MSMKSWAENEVRIATENSDDGYGGACAHSALRAFKSLCEDGHTGCSINLTKNILNRLIACKPLTAIEDTPGVWGRSCRQNNVRSYQCTRMSSLFKNVYDDGHVEYEDIEDCYCTTLTDPYATFTNRLVRDICHEMWPITLPYYPKLWAKHFVLEELLTDEANGDYDTVGVLYVIDPNEMTKTDINRYFKESGDDWEEITEDEYLARKHMDEYRRATHNVNETNEPENTDGD